MKKIHFDYYRSTFNLICFLVVVIGVILTWIGLFSEEENKLTHIGMILNSIGFTFSFGKMFFMKPYIGWNKKGMNIKINSFIPKNILFKNIKSYSVENKVLKIIYTHNEEVYDLQQIRSTDISKLDELLKELITSIN